jgi:hypothetical protein
MVWTRPVGEDVDLCEGSSDKPRGDTTGNARDSRSLIHGSYGLIADLSLELPKWTRVSQRLNPPGF